MNLLRNIKNCGGGANLSYSHSFGKNATNSAFTLAEMMVVMLILSIIMAAMAPVMTTRNKTDYSSPWKYTTQNPSNAYFGAGTAQIALIGQANAVEGDDIAKLVINTSDRSHIALKSGDSILARLHVDNDSNLFFSNISNLPTGTNNTGIGVGPLHSLTSGSYNTAIGSNALYSTTTGDSNTAIGYYSLRANTTGYSNTAIGRGTLAVNTTGGANVAIGLGALSANTVGEGNNAIGVASLDKNTTGAGNIAIGTDALKENTTGSHNVAIGEDAMRERVTVDHSDSVAIGYGASYSSLGDSTVAIGYGALHNARGNDNVAIGRSTFVDGKGMQNTIIGSMAAQTFGQKGDDDPDSNYNVIIGASAFNGKSTGSSNTVIGASAQANYSGENFDNVVTIGASAVAFTNAVAIGADSYASGLVAIGNGAHASGLHSIAIGTSAKGAENIAIGYQALQNNDPVALTTTHSLNNVAIGSSALGLNEWGNDNTAVGNYAGNLLYGNNNTIIGSGAGNYAGAGITTNNFSNMVAVGSNSRVTDDGVIAIGAGADAGVSNGGSAGTLRGTDSIAIGHGARAAGINTVSIGAGVQNFRNNVIQLGTAGQTVYIPGNLVVGGNVVLGYDNKKSVFLRGYNDNGDMTIYGGKKGGDNNLAITQAQYQWKGNTYAQSYAAIIGVLSDRRLKYVGKENTSGLDKIRQLKVFNYTYKKDTTKTPHVGVIAQDLQKVFPNAVKKGADGFLTIRMEDMFYALVNAVKELDAKITALQKENQELKATVKQIQDNNKQLEIRLNKLEAKVK